MCFVHCACVHTHGRRTRSASAVLAASPASAPLTIACASAPSVSRSPAYNVAGGGGGGGDVAAALRKAVAFCERKFCEANLPSADDDDHAEEEGSPRAEVRLRGGLWLGQLHTHALSCRRRSWHGRSTTVSCSDTTLLT
jgi:hypothetical protein